MPAGVGFSGFRPAAFAFLRGLAANNEKTWFEAHRAEYEREVKAPAARLALSVSDELARRDLPLSGDAKRSGFRIHRDVRFSNDKRPFKTANGTVWFRQGGSKTSSGVLYFHLVPGGCFAAAAFHMPDADTLDALREAIRVRPEAFVAVQTSLAAGGLTLSGADTLSRMPRGFEDLRGSHVADAIRLKSWVVQRPVPDAVAGSELLVNHLVTLAADAMPLLRFGWGAIDEVRAARDH